MQVSRMFHNLLHIINGSKQMDESNPKLPLNRRHNKRAPKKSFSLYVRGLDVDVYALGCLYIELFGWRGVWPGLNRVQIMQKM